MEYTSHYNSPLGQITLASNGTCLTGLWFEGQKFFARTLANCTQEKDLPVFHQTSEWLDCYFSGKKPDFTPALQLNDTPFRIAVWKILQQIPYGEVVTYILNLQKILLFKRRRKRIKQSGNRKNDRKQRR